MLGNGERLRVGVRRGMMWTGRERMAESYYEKAVAKRNEGDREGALWFAGAAADLNPKFIEAINLKEDLGGKVVTTADNSSVRTYLRKEMLMERPGTNQPAPRSVPID